MEFHWSWASFWCEFVSLLFLYHIVLIQTPHLYMTQAWDFNFSWTNWWPPQLKHWTNKQSSFYFDWANIVFQIPFYEQGRSSSQGLYIRNSFSASHSPKFMSFVPAPDFRAHTWYETHLGSSLIPEYSFGFYLSLHFYYMEFFLSFSSLAIITEAIGPHLSTSSAVQDYYYLLPWLLTVCLKALCWIGAHTAFRQGKLKTPEN